MEGDGRGGDGMEGREGGEREGKGREIKTPLLNGLPTGLASYMYHYSFSRIPLESAPVGRIHFSVLSSDGTQ